MRRRRLTHASISAMRAVVRLVAAFLPMLALAAPVRGQGVRLENETAYGYALFDLLEVAPGIDGRPLRWDMLGSVGKQYDRFWIKSDGDVSTSRRAGELEVQGLYSRLVAPFWEAQLGVRFDVAYAGGATTRTRSQLVLGLQGLAPYWFELEPALFVSQDGDLSAALVGSYDLFVTQRMILQPRLDLNVALQDVDEWGTSSGFNRVVLGARLRYEIEREFAPYVGLSWTRLTGGTADLARARGEDFSSLALVAGVRAWR